MVQIVIKTNPNQSEVEEWSLIELQGDLEVENGECLADKFLGDLHFTTEGTAILVLGHHTLHGKVVKLEKPYVLLRKNQRKTVHRVLNKKKKSRTDANGEEEEEAAASESSEELMIDDDGEQAEKNEQDEEASDAGPVIKTEYLIHAVIKQRILFNKRPRPIVFYQPKTLV